MVMYTDLIYTPFSNVFVIRRYSGANHYQTNTLFSPIRDLVPKRQKKKVLDGTCSKYFSLLLRKGHNSEHIWAEHMVNSENPRSWSGTLNTSEIP